MYKFIVKIGTPPALKAIDGESDHEHLITARNGYEAHKQAMSKAKGIEEILTITDENKNLIYDHITGFSKGL